MGYVTVPEAVQIAAERFGERVALVERGRALTFDELRGEVAVRAGALTVRPGDRVLIVAPNSIDMVLAWLAVIHAGAIPAAVNPELTAAAAGARFTTPSGMVLDGARDTIEAPRAKDAADDPDDDGVSNEIPTSVVDFMEFYLLNYFKPATGEQTARTAAGREIFKDVGCAACHVPNLTINHDRRVADVETVFNPEQGVFNRLFATASGRFVETNDGSGYPTVKKPGGGSFVVRNIFTDFKRHDLGPSFYERDYDGTVRTRFLTTAFRSSICSNPWTRSRSKSSESPRRSGSRPSS